MHILYTHKHTLRRWRHAVTVSRLLGNNVHAKGSGVNPKPYTPNVQSQIIRVRMPGAHDLVNARVTHACAHVSAARGGACIVEEHMCAHVQACTCISSATIHAPQRVPGTVPADCTRVCKYTHNGNDTNFGLAKALACFKFRGPVCKGPCTFKTRLHVSREPSAHV